MESREFTIDFICYDDVKQSVKLTYSEFDMEVKNYKDLMDDFKQKLNIQSKVNLPLKTLHLEEIPTFLHEESLSYIYSLSPFYFEKPILQDHSIKIDLKQSTGKIITLKDVDVNNTIEDVKKMIREKEKIMLEKQKLILDGKELEDCKTLRDYQITNDSIFDFVVRNQGGIVAEKCFVDMEAGKTKNLNFSKDAPDWRRCNKGLNIFGECENEKCKAYKKEVICPIDRNCYDLILDSQLSKCPICKENFVPKTCGFWKCSYSWSGLKLVEGKEKRFSLQKWTTVGEKFEYFDEKANGSVEWRQLKVLTKFDTPKMLCGVCRKELDANSSTKQCGHFYHAKCLDDLEFKLKMNCVQCM